MSVVAVRTRHGHSVIGTEAAEVRAQLEAYVAEGRLVESGLLGHGRTRGGLYVARVRLLEVAPRRRVRRGVVVAAVVSAAVVLGVAGWLAVLVLSWLAAHVWQVVAVALIVGLALAALGRVGVSVTATWTVPRRPR